MDRNGYLNPEAGKPGLVWTRVGRDWVYSMLTTDVVFAVLNFIMLVILLILVGIIFHNTDNGKFDNNQEDINGNILSDVANLNGALAAEHLEYAAYQAVLTQFPTFGLPFTPATGVVVPAAEAHTLIAQFGATEGAHVTFLTNLITSQCASLPSNLQTGCAPVPACLYGLFPTPFADQVAAVTFLQSLETLGESFYVGLVPELYNSQNALYAAGIEAVEAQHAAVLNIMLGNNPTPVNIVAPTSGHTTLCDASAYVSNAATCAPFAGLSCP